MSSLAFLSYVGVFSVTSAFAGQLQINVTPRTNATLECWGPRDAAITVLEWSRSDLELGYYVFFYRNGRSYEKYQHSSFQGRVELRDREMKEGDVSVILRNIAISDTGTYVCRITISSTQHFNTTISLKVKEPGSGAGHTEDGGKTDKIITNGENKDVNVGLCVGLSVFAVLLCLVAFIIIKRKCVRETFYQLLSQRTGEHSHTDKSIFSSCSITKA